MPPREDICPLEKALMISGGKMKKKSFGKRKTKLRSNLTKVG